MLFHFFVGNYFLLEILKIEKLPNLKPDSKIEFKEILAYGDNKIIEIGAPTIEGAKVEANLVEEDCTTYHQR